MRLTLCRAAEKCVGFIVLCLVCVPALAGQVSNPDWIFGAQSSGLEILTGGDGLLRWRSSADSGWHEEKLGDATVDMAVADPSGQRFLALSNGRAWHGERSAADMRWTPALEGWKLSKIGFDSERSAWLAWACRSERSSECAVLTAAISEPAGQGWQVVGQGATPELRLVGVDSDNRAIASAMNGRLWISETRLGEWQSVPVPKKFMLSEVVYWKRAGPWWAGMTRDQRVLLVDAARAKAFAVAMPTGKPGGQGSGWTAAAYDAQSATLMLGGADGRIALLAAAGRSSQPAFSLRAARLPYVEQLAFDAVRRQWLALSNDGQLFASINAGLEWTLEKRFGQVRPNGLAQAADGRLLMWGDGGFIAHRSPAEGWVLEQPDLSRYINHILVSPAGSLLAVGVQGLIARAAAPSGRPADWRVIDAGLGYGQYLSHALAYPGSQTLLAAGSSATIVRSTDDGASWQTVFKHADGALGNFQRIAIHPQSRVALVVANPGWVMRSADEGATWQNTAEGAVLQLKDVLALPGAGFVAVGEGGSVLFFDAQGRLQRQLAIAASPVWYQIREAAGALWVMGDGNKLLRISLDGQQVEEIGLGQHFLARDIISPAPDVLIVAGARGALLRSADGGQHWQVVNAGVQANLRRLLQDEKGHLWVTGREGVLLRSQDAGLSWQALPSGTIRHFKDGLLLPGTHTLLLYGERLLALPAAHR
ncbi:YCF48-related protein [Uliginosibacterium sp. TH139]|uniref:WD40/YVTN/BNR-like repeat-containing protein n=1 Tax=Uliginosibacterium sp. TH139 TaxID=2067453 RepID=UPI00117F954F|nr:YCF48-related protein [Uliginosibacterium sp. TH139]